MRSIRYCLLFVGLGLASFTVRADDWGCEVLLCLSNPAGPMAAPACVPPITRLYKALRKSKPDPFPTCSSANGAAVATPGFGYFDPCPQGTTELAAGQRAVQLPVSLAQQFNNTGWQASRFTASPSIRQVVDLPQFVGVGDGTASEAAGPKVCVAGKIGDLSFPLDNDGSNWFIAGAYQRVTVLQPASSPSYIDVFANGQLMRRVRY